VLEISVSTQSFGSQPEMGDSYWNRRGWACCIEPFSEQQRFKSSSVGLRRLEQQNSVHEFEGNANVLRRKMLAEYIKEK
jgi:hypothetical protein